MLEVVLSLLVIVSIATILMHHHHMKRQTEISADINAQIIREAARRSLRASANDNVFEALRELERAEQSLEDALLRGGTSPADMNGVDLAGMLKEIRSQRMRTLDEYYVEHPVLDKVENLPDTVQRFLKVPGS